MSAIKAPTVMYFEDEEMVVTWRKRRRQVVVKIVFETRAIIEITHVGLRLCETKDLHPEPLPK